MFQQVALQYQDSLCESDLPEVVPGLSSHDVKVGKFYTKRKAEVNLMKIIIMNL